MEQNIKIISDGVEIAGIVHMPDDLKEGDKRPAFISIHGFGGSKIDSSMVDVCRTLCEWGYIALRLDMRGCGESDGPKGRIIALEQVGDTRNAITWLTEQPSVDSSKIVLLGDSMGGAIVTYTGSTDDRVAGVVSVGGWGNGAKKLEGQHPGPGEWDKFLTMLEKGREHKEKTGESLMVSRFDIVPIPEHMRSQLPADAVMEFPVDTAQSIYDFMPNDVIADLAPRPILLLHAAKDAVTPTESSIDMFEQAGRPKDLVFLSEIDHFPMGVGNQRIYDIFKGWLELYFPLKI